jgi:hypothetical protein
MAMSIPVTTGGGGNRHSDKEKFRSDLNRPESCEMSGRLLETLRIPEPSKLNTRVSIPFIRSNSQNLFKVFLISCRKVMHRRQLWLHTRARFDRAVTS